MRWAMLGVALAAFMGAAGTVSAQEPSGPPTLENLLQGGKQPTALPAVVDASESQSKAVPPAGTCVRPKEGMKHPDLDKAWVDYDGTVTKISGEIRAAISKHFDSAAAKADLDQADKWQRLQDKFEKKGVLPDEDATKAIVSAATAQFKNARDVLKEAYAEVVKTLTVEKKIAEAKQVREEWLTIDGNPGFIKPQIPKDAIRIGKHSYYVFLDLVTQDQAAAECKKRGGYLARITDPEEFKAFNKKLLLLQQRVHFWIDGTDAKKEGTWTFLDGNLLPEVPWLPHEPSNRGGFGEQDGLAIQVTRANSGWIVGMDDLEVGTKVGFICEWDE